MRSLGDRTVDLLVIGGGIIGAGIARDAALRGLEVAVVEQADFGSGTTSRPTRLIHGGLRYLELFDFALVRSDMREREILLRIAPHLVFPLAFLLPLYRPTFFYQLKLRIGMQLYDALSLDKSLPRRQHLDRAATLAAEPSLEPLGLVGAWRFYDAQVPLVERLVVENLVDAAERGALVLNHARVIDFLREGDRILGARVRDTVADSLQGFGYVILQASSGNAALEVVRAIHVDLMGLLQGIRSWLAHLGRPQKRPRRFVPQLASVCRAGPGGACEDRIDDAHSAPTEPRP